mmetsp:Transcript_16064/g.37896  ORF Transcript_16064/g.37896 Transcript_16064/m.37896 type:complete len:482 (+) Transcript_16064:84-1529(+)
MISTPSSDGVPIADLGGILEVVIVGATRLRNGLQIGQFISGLDKTMRDAKHGSHLMGAPDAFVRMSIDCGKTAFETSTRRSDSNPFWDEKFHFDLADVRRTSISRLCFTIIDEDYSEGSASGDIPIGNATMLLTGEQLAYSKRRWRTKWLMVKDPTNDELPAGRLQIFFRWNPSGGIPVLGFVEKQWNSASACNTLGFAHSLLAGALLFTAAVSSSWLLLPVPNFASAAGSVIGSSPEAVPVPGASTLVGFACLCAFNAALAQMMGAVGAWPGWTPGFKGFSMQSEEDTLREIQTSDEGRRDAPAAVLRVTGNLLSGLEFSFGGNVFSKIPQSPVRVVCWMQQIGIALFACLALAGLMWRAQLFPGCFAGEAVYLTFAGQYANVVAVVCLERSALMMKRSAEELEASLRDQLEAEKLAEERNPGLRDSTRRVTKKWKPKSAPGCFAFFAGLPGIALLTHRGDRVKPHTWSHNEMRRTQAWR